MKSSFSIIAMAKLKPLRWAKRLLSILSCLTIGVSVLGTPLVVSAIGSDDEITVLEPWQYTAFMYFYNNGYNNYYDYENNYLRLSVSTVNYNANDHIINFNGTIDDNGNNATYYKLAIPWLSGSFNHVTAYSDYNCITTHDNESIYICFVTNRNLLPYTTTPVNVYSYYGWDSYYTVNTIYTQELPLDGAKYFKYLFRIDNSGIPFPDPNDKVDWITLDFPRISDKVIPIYLGNGQDVDDSVRQQFGIETTTEAYLRMLVSGSVSAEENIQTNQQVQSEFDDKNTEYHTYESTINQNMEDAYDDVDMTNNLYSNNKFIASANWVKTQFERLVLNTPFELIIVFSLILGIALIFAGKVR